MTLEKYLSHIRFLVNTLKAGRAIALTNPMDLIYAARQLANAQLDEVA